MEQVVAIGPRPEDPLARSLRRSVMGWPPLVASSVFMARGERAVKVLAGRRPHCLEASTYLPMGRPAPPARRRDHARLRRHAGPGDEDRAERQGWT